MKSLEPERKKYSKPIPKADLEDRRGTRWETLHDVEVWNSLIWSIPLSNSKLQPIRHKDYCHIMSILRCFSGLQQEMHRVLFQWETLRNQDLQGSRFVVLAARFALLRYRRAADWVVIVGSLLVIAVRCTKAAGLCASTDRGRMVQTSQQGAQKSHALQDRPLLVQAWPSTPFSRVLSIHKKMEDHLPIIYHNVQFEPFATRVYEGISSCRWWHGVWIILVLSDTKWAILSSKVKTNLMCNIWGLLLRCP